MFGLTINDKHTYRDFGLLMTSFYIPLPKVRENVVAVPFASGNIDFTEITGEPTYNDRDGLKFTFAIQDKSWMDWETIKTELAMFLHGKKLKLIPDNETGYYYLARLHVDSEKKYKSYGVITLTGTAEPFKYDLQTSDEDWLWDPFNFYTGVIRNYANIHVTDGMEYTMAAGGMNSVPEFVVTQSTNLHMTCGNKTYDMSATGTYRFPQIKVGSQPVTLSFTGSGTITIRYRGKYL